MTPERWQQIKGVLDQALDLKPEQRTAFLAQACAGDHELRQEVESLLAAGEEGRSSFLQSPPTLQIGKGTRLGDFEFQSLLGAGGMGEVYRARDVRLRRDVAIKVLPAFVASNPERLRRFEQEALAAAALNHPNILAVYQLGAYQGTPFLVSELLEGETLREQIKRGRIPQRRAIDYAVNVAHGLAAAHEKGIVHRDLKPENLFITKDGRVKILDFGLAKLTQTQNGNEHSAVTIGGGETEPGMVMGTVGYMSPEQVRGESVDHRGDIFSFGAILFEMLTGHRAFQKPTSAETMTAILNEEPQDFSQIAPSLAPALQRIIQHCLDKNPQRRFHSASDLAFALEALSDSGAAATASPTTERRRLWPVLAFSGIALLVAMIAGGIYWFSHRSESAAIHSIAVLPFANASKNPEMDYLGDGISEEITNSLSRLPNLQVMARSTVSHYKSRQDDPLGLGHDLHVDAVLTGRVLEHGGELDVEAELVSVATGAQLWGERYTRSTSDASLLQAAITSEVANKLRLQLSNSEKEELGRIGTRNAEAYKFYLKGRYQYEKFSERDFASAIDSFQSAIAKDTTYAAAYAGLADASVMLGYFSSAGRDIFEKGQAAARQALTLDSRIAEPHISLALADIVHFWNFAEAEAELREALAINPNSAYAHEAYCWFDTSVGRAQAAIAECQKAVDLEPLSGLANASLQFCYFYTRDYDRSLEQAAKSLKLDPNNYESIVFLGYLYEAQGKYKMAMVQWVKAAQHRGEEAEARTREQMFEKGGYREFLKWDAKMSEASHDFSNAAGNYAMLGDKEAAFAALERAFTDRTGLVWVKVDPALDTLHSDPRFANLLRRIGMPQ